MCLTYPIVDVDDGIGDEQRGRGLVEERHLRDGPRERLVEPPYTHTQTQTQAQTETWSEGDTSNEVIIGC
jgi:hypothetical protein